MAQKKKTQKKTQKKTKKKAAPKRGGEQDTVVVGSKVKAAIKAAGCNSSSDVLPALNGYVHWIISQAAKRAAANNRKTVRAHDILIME